LPFLAHIYVKRMSMCVNNVSCLSMHVALYDDYEAVYVHIICHYISRAWFAKGPRSTYIAVIGQFLSSHFFHHSVSLIQLGILVSSSIVISLSLTKYHLSKSCYYHLLYLPLPWLQICQYHCHIYCSLKTWLVQLPVQGVVLCSPSKISNKSSSSNSELSCSGCS